MVLLVVLAGAGCSDDRTVAAPPSTTAVRPPAAVSTAVQAVFGCGPLDGQAIVVRTNGFDFGPLTAVVVLDGTDVAGATAGVDGVSRFVVDMQRRPLDPAEQLRATVEVRSPAGRVVGRAGTIAPLSPKAACG